MTKIEEYVGHKVALTDSQVISVLDDMNLLDLQRSGSHSSTPSRVDQVVGRVDWESLESPIFWQTEALADQSQWERVRGAVLNGIDRANPVPPPTPIDALAWYAPIHFYGTEWGIFIRELAALDVARSILLGLSPTRRTELDAIAAAVRQSISILYLHEAFHHKVESFAVRLEIVRRARVYAPYSAHVFGPLSQSSPDEVLEEGLASGEMMDRLTEPAYTRGVPADVRRATMNMLLRWIPTLPAGYNRGLEMRGPAAAAFRRELSSQVDEGAIYPVRPSSEEWRLAKDSYRGLFGASRVAYTVIPVGTEPVIPHVDRPIPQLSVSTKQARKLLQEHGFTQVAGGKGSHMKFKKPGAEMVILPQGRKSLSYTVLRSVRDALGLDSFEAMM